MFIRPPHILPHDYATGLYHAGVDIITAQYLLGHKKITMTLEIYTHLQNKTDIFNEDVSEKMNHYLYGSQMVISSENDVKKE